MADDRTPAGAVSGSAGGRWRVRQVHHGDKVLSRVEGPAGQRYAPHAVLALRVAEVRRLHEALLSSPPASQVRQRHARLVDVLADALPHPSGRENE